MENSTDLLFVDEMKVHAVTFSFLLRIVDFSGRSRMVT